MPISKCTFCHGAGRSLGWARRPAAATRREGSWPAGVEEAEEEEEEEELHSFGACGGGAWGRK